MEFVLGGSQVVRSECSSCRLNKDFRHLTASLPTHEPSNTKLQYNAMPFPRQEERPFLTLGPYAGEALHILSFAAAEESGSGGVNVEVFWGL